jgi:hypothetical protein
MEQLQRKSNPVLTENTTGTITKGDDKLYTRKKCMLVTQQGNFKLSELLLMEIYFNNNINNNNNNYCYSSL